MTDAVKNYITPGGYRRLQEELARLWKVERPPVVTTVAWAAGNGDRSENGDYIYGEAGCARSTGASAISRRVSTGPLWSTTRARRTSRSISARPSRSTTRAATSARSRLSAWTSSIPATHACPGARRWPGRCSRQRSETR